MGTSASAGFSQWEGKGTEALSHSLGLRSSAPHHGPGWSWAPRAPLFSTCPCAQGPQARGSPHRCRTDWLALLPALRLPRVLTLFPGATGAHFRCSPSGSPQPIGSCVHTDLRVRGEGSVADLGASGHLGRLQEALCADQGASWEPRGGRPPGQQPSLFPDSCPTSRALGERHPLPAL